MSVQVMTPPIESEGQPRLVTGEELLQMGDIGRSELVKGEVVKMSPTGQIHAKIEIKVGGILEAFASQHRLGDVYGGEIGIYIQRDPDTVRAADVAFVSNERLTQAKSKSYLDVAPELVVEILSPDDKWSELMEKLDEYFSIDVKVVWVIDPRKQQVYVYRSTTDVQRFNAADTLTGGDTLPGFSISVSAFFPNA